MAFKITLVKANEIHLIGKDNTFKDEANILEMWENVRGGRNANLLIEVHDDHEFVLKPFSNEVTLPAHDQPIWSSRIVVGTEVLKGLDPTQDIWMPIKRQIKELQRAQRDFVKCENIIARSKSGERREEAKLEKADCETLVEALTEAGWDVDGLFVTFITNRNTGSGLQMLDLYTNGCLRETVRDEVQAATPEQAVDQDEVDIRFAYRSAAAHRCVIFQLLKTLKGLIDKKPLNGYEIKEVTMSFAEALDARIMDAEVAGRYAAKRS